MTKPRKEQIQNLKTNYRTVLSANALYLDTSFNTFRFKNDSGNSNFAYNTFLNQTFTKSPRGADKNSPAIIYGMTDVPSPWTATTGSSFTIRMTGLNSGNPMTVTLAAGDYTNIGGVNRLTCFGLCNRINTVLTSFGATVPAARNEYGRIVIQSVDASGYSVGADKSITLTDVTAGVLFALGLSSNSTITATGVNGSTRGIVTESPDGYGGYVPLRESSTGAVPYPKPGVLIRSLIVGSTPIQYIPENDVKAPVYGRIRYIPGPVNDGRYFEIAAFQQRLVGAQIVIERPAISTLDNTDSMVVQFRDAPTFGNILATATITFSTSVNPTFSTIVEQINSVWGSTLGGGAYTNNPRNAVVALARGPYNFPESCSFRFANVTVNFVAGSRYTESELATLIQAAITAANAVQYSCQIESGIGVTIRRTVGGDLTIQAPIDQSMRALDILGVAPGIYRGLNIASLYGTDAIAITNPHPNSFVRITCSSGTAAKLGIATSVTATSGTPIASRVQIFGDWDYSVPESMEFWEVPDSVEADDRQFLVDARTITTAQAYLGTSNTFGISSLQDPNGRIPASLLPPVYDALQSKRLQLFGKIGSTINPDYVSPSIVTYTGLTDAASLKVVVEGNPDASYATGIPGLRIMFGRTKHVFTINAKQASNGVDTWTKDVNGDVASQLEFKNNVLTGYTIASGTNSWANSGWTSTWSLGGTVNAANLIATGLTTGLTFNLGGDGTMYGTGSANPRISTTRANTAGATPSGTNKYTLIFESGVNGSGAFLPLRIYLSHSVTQTFSEASTNGFLFTVNSKWNPGSGLWSRDVTTEFGSAWVTTHLTATDIGATNQGKQGFGLLRSPNTDTWADTGWTKTGFYSTEQSLNGDYSTMSLFGSPTIAMGPTAISASNTILSWGKLFYGASVSIATNTPGPTDIAFNVASATRTGGGAYTVTYTNSVGAYSTVIMGSTSNTTNIYFQSPTQNSSNFTVVKIVSGTQSDGATNVGGSHITMGQLRNGYIYP